MNQIHLLIIDPQNDFCSLGGSLFVKGANYDMERLSNMIGRLNDKIDKIHVTLDSHHVQHIAHPIFWQDKNGKHPDPFTVINVEDILNEKWVPVNANHWNRADMYIQNLKATGQDPLVIWPPHCLIGSQGHNVYPTLFNTLCKWEENSPIVNYIQKGSNPFTEHYSAIQAAIPDPNDKNTQINTQLMEILEKQASCILVAGQASTHCVNNTIRDIIKNFKHFQSPGKIVLLKDAMSPVPGFEHLADKFFADMDRCGVRFSTTTEILKDEETMYGK